MKEITAIVLLGISSTFVIVDVVIFFLYYFKLIDNVFNTLFYVSFGISISTSLVGSAVFAYSSQDDTKK